MCCWALFSVLAPPEFLIYEMAENGKNCDQRRIAMSKEQHNGSLTGKDRVAAPAANCPGAMMSVFLLGCHVNFLTNPYTNQVVCLCILGWCVPLMLAQAGRCL